MRVSESPGELGKLGLLDDRQWRFDRMPSERGQEIRRKFRDCGQRRRLPLIGRRAAWILRAAAGAGDRRTLARHLTGSRNSEQRLRHCRNHQQ